MIETRADFARRIGVHKSTITRAAQTGRLVLTAAGDVEVETSIERWYATKAGRDDVAARHAANRDAGGGMDSATADRGAKGAEATPTTGSATNATRPGEAETRATASARKESAGADLLELERAQKLGALIAKEDVYAAMRFIGGVLRAALDVMPDQTAPLLAPITDLDQVHDALTEACRGVLASVGEAIERQRRELDVVKPSA